MLIDEKEKPSAYCILDTETTSLPNQKVQYVFDLAYSIVDKKTNQTILTKTFIVKELVPYISEAYYYSQNREYYTSMLLKELDKIKPFAEIMKIMGTDLIQNNVDLLMAYNATFDLTAIQNTYALLNIAKNFELALNKLKIDYKCLMKMSISSVAKDEKMKYRAYMLVNGYVTPNGNVNTTAEAMYNYLRYSLIKKYNDTEIQLDADYANKELSDKAAKYGKILLENTKELEQYGMTINNKEIILENHNAIADIVMEKQIYTMLKEMYENIYKYPSTISWRTMK